MKMSIFLIASVPLIVHQANPKNDDSSAQNQMPSDENGPAPPSGK